MLCADRTLSEGDIVDPTHIAEAASLLVAARQRRSRIGVLPEVCRPRSVADAHAIQDAVTAMLGRR